MSECSFHNHFLRPGWGLRSGRRWALLNLAVIMLFAGWQPYYVGVQTADATAELTGLDEAQAQTNNPRSEILVGSPELWKFRLINAAAIGAR